MKMIRLLFCTLLLAVLPQGVLLAQEAQNVLPVSGKVYKITNIHDGYTFGENANGTLVNQALAGTETATQLWLCVAGPDGRYAFVNASSGRCLNSGKSWTTQRNAEYFYLVSTGTQASDATYGAGKTVYNITTSSTAAGSTCLHCWASAAPQNYLGSGGGSKWTFEEATTVTLTTINASLGEYMASLKAAKETFASAVNGVSVTPLTLNATVESEDNPSAQNYLWSNAPHKNNEFGDQVGGCAALLDGNTTTYFHSRYSGDDPNEHHYLQINKITDAPTAFRLRMTSRDFARNKPTELLISGSMDGTNFVPITTLRQSDYTPLFPCSSDQESYVSKVLSTGKAYSYLRFTVKQTNTGNSFGSYPFFSLAEFAIDKVTGTTNTTLVDYAAKYATLHAAVTTAQGDNEMSAIYLPAYYTVGDLDAVNTAVAAQANSVGDGTPDLELQPMDYYVYYTNERGERKYLSITINADDTYAVKLSDDPAVFTFIKSTAAGVSTNAFIMQMNGYHIGHWDSGNEAFNHDPNTNRDTYTSAWHAQAFYYDANHAKLAIRNTNANVDANATDADNYYAHYFMYVDPKGNLKGVPSSADNAHLLYQWTVQPVYPFALNGEKKYFIKTRVGTDQRRLLRMNLTGNANNVPLVEGKNSTSDAYWQFAQAESYGHYYLRIIPCVNTAKVLSYQASGVGNGANKFTAQNANASGYQQNFLLGPTGNAGAPYYFRVPSTTFYMSNHGGTSNNMGFYDVLNDAGSRFAIIEVPENACFYRLKGHSSGNYMDASGVADSDNRMSMKSEAECSATGSVFYLTAGNKLLSLNKGLYLKDTYSLTAQGADAGNTLTIFPSEGDVEGKYTLYTNFSGSKYVYDNTEKIDRNPSYAAQCNWTLEPVTKLPVNISSVGWATFYAPVPIHIPAEGDLAAYTVAINETAGTCALTKVTGDIPANTGLVLRKCNGGLVYIDIAQSGAADVSTNNLTGTIETISHPGNYTYALQRSVDQQYVGLFLYNSGNIPGFRSYYHSASQTAMRNGFAFNTDDPSTAITEVPDAMPQVQQGIYDLSGRRVSQPTRGIYIVGGKKTIIR